MRATRPTTALTAVALAAALLAAGPPAIASGPPSSTPTFESSVPLTTSTLQVAAGDLNGDGLVDIVTYDSGNTVTIFTNQIGSPGTFVASAPVAVADCEFFSFDAGPAGIGILCGNGVFVLLDGTGTELARDVITIDTASFEGEPDLVEPTTVNGLDGFAVGHNEFIDGNNIGTVTSFTWDGLVLSRVDVAAPAPATFGFELYLDLKAIDIAGVPSVAWAVYSQTPAQIMAVIYLPTNGSSPPSP